MSFYNTFENENDGLWEAKAEEVESMRIQKVCAELCDISGDDYISVKSEDDVRETLTEKLVDDVLEYEPEYDSMRGL